MGTESTEGTERRGKSRFLSSLGMTNSGDGRKTDVWGGVWLGGDVWLGEGNDEGVDAEGGAEGKVVEGEESGE